MKREALNEYIGHRVNITFTDGKSAEGIFEYSLEIEEGNGKSFFDSDKNRQKSPPPPPAPRRPCGSRFRRKKHPSQIYFWFSALFSKIYMKVCLQIHISMVYYYNL